MRHSRGRKVFALAAGVALVMAAAACGGDSGDDGNGTGSKTKEVPLVFGTTENFVGADPASSYDWPSSLLLTNTSQTVLEIPAGGNQPAPDIAESCEFSDPKTYTCKLKSGLKFSDGSPLTSDDVKFSMDRLIGIADDQGPSSIYEPSLASTEAPDPTTVTYKLKYADATWPMRLTYGGAAVVPKEKYSATAIQKKDYLGSGPYKIAKFDPSQQIVLDANPNYTGANKPIHKQVIIQKYKDEASLKTAVEEGAVQVAFRTLSPTLIADLEKNGAKKNVKVLKGEGVGISYVVFNLLNGPFKDKAVRQAAAYLIDRETIATEIYDNTVDPLYTMVPSAFPGSTESFKTKYGDKPNAAQARKVLQEAGVTIPVKAQLWWNPDHYGQTSADMYAEIERQLEKDGLFDLSLKNAAWDRYREDYPKGVYPAFQLGWFPDFPDADNYLSPFYQTGNFMEKGSGYSSKNMDKLLNDERSNTDATARQPVIEQAQTLGAEDVPTLPIWQDKMIAATRDGVTGVEKTFDAAYQIRFWLIDATKAK